MKKPIILTVEDEEQVRNAVERDLRKQYRSDYRVIKTGSGRHVSVAIREQSDDVGAELTCQEYVAIPD